MKGNGGKEEKRRRVGAEQGEGRGEHEAGKWGEVGEMGKEWILSKYIVPLHEITKKELFPLNFLYSCTVVYVCLRIQVKTILRCSVGNSKHQAKRKGS